MAESVRFPSITQPAGRLTDRPAQGVNPKRKSKVKIHCSFSYVKSNLTCNSKCCNGTSNHSSLQHGDGRGLSALCFSSWDSQYLSTHQKQIRSSQGILLKFEPDLDLSICSTIYDVIARSQTHRQTTCSAGCDSSADRQETLQFNEKTIPSKSIDLGGIRNCWSWDRTREWVKREPTMEQDRGQCKLSTTPSRQHLGQKDLEIAIIANKISHTWDAPANVTQTMFGQFSNIYIQSIKTAEVRSIVSNESL